MPRHKLVNLSPAERKERHLEQMRKANRKMRYDPERQGQVKEYFQSYYQYRKAFKELCNINLY